MPSLFLRQGLSQNLEFTDLGYVVWLAGPRVLLVPLALCCYIRHVSHRPSLLSYTGAEEGTWVLMTARQALPTQPSLQPHDEIILETASDSRAEMKTFLLPPLLFPFPVEKP